MKWLALMDEVIPLFPLNTVLFPGMYLPLHIFEDRYRLMIQHCLETEQVIGVTLIRSGAEAGGPATPYSVGTTARIIHLSPQEDGRFYLVAQGEERFRIREIKTDKPYMEAVVEPLLDTDEGEDGLASVSKAVGVEFKRYIALLLSFANKWIVDFDLPLEPDVLSFYIASRINIQPIKKQRLVELSTTRQRLMEEKEIMRREMAQMELLASAKSPEDGRPLS